MKHLKSDYEAIVQAVNENPLDSEEDIRKLQLEIIEFVMAFAQELEKREKQVAKLTEAIQEMGEDVDFLLDGLSKNYLDVEVGERIVSQLQNSMQLIASLVKTLEDEFGIDDIKKKQIRSIVEPHLQESAALLEELEDIIDKDEDDDDGEPDGDSDGDDGDGGDGDEPTEDEDEGATEEGA